MFNQKYHSLKNDFAVLIKKLADKPQQGTALGNNFYKIRLSIIAKGKGKSGGTSRQVNSQTIRQSVIANLLILYIFLI